MAGDLEGNNSSWIELRFNSRPRVAGDKTFLMAANIAHGVSIHARAWRATQHPNRELTAFKFQFTPARGGRLTVALMVRKETQFQFTPARGGRRNTHP